MKGFAVAAVGLLLGCGSKTIAANASDGSPEADATFEGAGEAPAEASVAPDRVTYDTSDSSKGVDASSDGDVASADAPEAGLPPGCAKESVPPSTLVCTGLYTNIATKTLAARVQFFRPAVPLWSDDAQKMRWIQLPPATQIDASDPNEWRFPIGTKVWKEFSKNNKRVETRLFQKVDNGPPPIWAHATYAWNADESAAVGSGGGDIVLDGDGGTYHIPTFAECEKCHNGRTDNLLGFEQVSLGMTGAMGLTLSELVNQGLISPAPAQMQPTIGDDGTGVAAPALAWLHVNCGVSCHNSNSNSIAYARGLRLRLDPTLLDGRPISDFDSLTTTIGVAATSTQWIAPIHWTRIVPGDPNQSLLFQLIAHRGTNDPAKGQMPPIATSIVDADGVFNKVGPWIMAMPAAQTTDGGSDAGLDANGWTGGDAAPDATFGEAGD
jgi:hypothetical protein